MSRCYIAVLSTDLILCMCGEVGAGSGELVKKKQGGGGQGQGEAGHAAGRGDLAVDDHPHVARPLALVLRHDLGDIIG